MLVFNRTIVESVAGADRRRTSPRRRRRVRRFVGHHRRRRIRRRPAWSSAALQAAPHLRVHGSRISALRLCIHSILVASMALYSACLPSTYNRQVERICGGITGVDVDVAALAVHLRIVGFSRKLAVQVEKVTVRRLPSWSSLSFDTLFTVRFVVFGASKACIWPMPFSSVTLWPLTVTTPSAPTVTAIGLHGLVSDGARFLQPVTSRQEFECLFPGASGSPNQCGTSGIFADTLH